MIPIEELLAKPVNFSTLKWMAESPLHYRANVRTEARHLELGSATDSLLLGAIGMSREVIAYPGKQRRGKDWEAYKAENAGKLIVTRKELALAEGMRDSVLASPYAVEALKGRRQEEIFWEYMGRKCVSHLDCADESGVFVTELKTAQTSNPARFRWQAFKFAYHAQLAFYRLAKQHQTGRKPSAAYIVVVGSKAPHVTVVMKLSDRALELGERLIRIWFETLLNCEKANQWPGYAQTIIELDAPDDVDLEFDLNELEPAGEDETIT
jgi:hypothetical protein